MLYSGLIRVMQVSTRVIRVIRVIRINRVGLSGLLGLIGLLGFCLLKCTVVRFLLLCESLGTSKSCSRDSCASLVTDHKRPSTY